MSLISFSTKTIHFNLFFRETKSPVSNLVFKKSPTMNDMNFHSTREKEDLLLNNKQQNTLLKINQITQLTEIKHFSNITITNHSDTLAVFRIRTNKKQLYSIGPSYFYIDSNKSLDVNFILLLKTLTNEEFNKHKFKCEVIYGINRDDFYAKIKDGNCANIVNNPYSLRSNTIINSQGNNNELVKKQTRSNLIYSNNSSFKNISLDNNLGNNNNSNINKINGITAFEQDYVKEIFGNNDIMGMYNIENIILNVSVELLPYIPKTPLSTKNMMSLNKENSYSLLNNNGNNPNTNTNDNTNKSLVIKNLKKDLIDSIPNLDSDVDDKSNKNTTTLSKIDKSNKDKTTNENDTKVDTVKSKFDISRNQITTVNEVDEENSQFIYTEGSYSNLTYRANNDNNYNVSNNKLLSSSNKIITKDSKRSNKKYDLMISKPDMEGDTNNNLDDDLTLKVKKSVAFKENKPSKPLVPNNIITNNDTNYKDMLKKQSSSYLEDMNIIIDNKSTEKQDKCDSKQILIQSNSKQNIEVANNKESKEKIVKTTNAFKRLNNNSSTAKNKQSLNLTENKMFSNFNILNNSNSVYLQEKQNTIINESDSSLNTDEFLELKEKCISKEEIKINKEGNNNKISNKNKGIDKDWYNDNITTDISAMNQNTSYNNYYDDELINLIETKINLINEVKVKLFRVLELHGNLNSINSKLLNKCLVLEKEVKILKNNSNCENNVSKLESFINKSSNVVVTKNKILMLFIFLIGVLLNIIFS